MIRAFAADLDESDEFPLADPARPGAGGPSCAASSPSSPARDTRWRAPASGSPAICPAAPGLSSSAALEVALCLALLELGSSDRSWARGDFDRLEIARLCSRVENDWVGAQTGLLDQLASIFGVARMRAVHRLPDAADRTGGARARGLAAVPAGLRRTPHQRQLGLQRAAPGVRERMRAARGGLAVAWPRRPRSARLPDPLRLRAEPRRRARTSASAGPCPRCGRGDLPALGALINASHASLRDLFAVSTPALDDAVERMRAAGAAGARMMGGGFGGSVLGLFPPGVDAARRNAARCAPGPGAHLLGGASFEPSVDRRADGRRGPCDTRAMPFDPSRSDGRYLAAEARYERMPYRRVGGSGLKLPALSLGLWQNFGDDRPLAGSRAILRRAFDLGITHLRPRQQLRAAVRVGGAQLRPDLLRGPAPLSRRARHLHQGRV